jgi:phosphohistidine phosphatase
VLVYLLRHGEAEPHGSRPDEQRRLTENGSRRLREAAPIFRRLATDVGRVYASPLVRAQQTAEAFLSAIGRTELLSSPTLEPEADPEAALELLAAEARRGTAGVALVGHEPHLGALLGLLLTQRRDSPIPLSLGMLVRLRTQLPTAATARLLLALSADGTEALLGV